MRVIILDTIAGMETEMAAEANFNSKIVADALESLIDQIIKIVTEITTVYSDPGKCTPTCLSFLTFLSDSLS